MSRLTKWVGASAAAGLTAFTVFSGTAAGFFPPLPLGSDTPPTVAPQVPVVPKTVPPTNPQPVVPVSPPPFVPTVPKTVDPKPKVPPTVPPCNCDPGPVHCVPEPATVVTGLVGVSLLAVGAVRRKFRGKPTA